MSISATSVTQQGITRHRYFLIPVRVFFILCFCSCVNLKEVHDYSASSAKTINKFEELGYSFSKACAEKCLVEQLEKQQLSKLACHCPGEKTADSVTNLLYDAIKGYFEGLANLSGNQLTSYKFNPLAKALKESQFGDVSFNKEQVDAFANIASILSRAVTDVYRKKKLSVYIGDANSSIKTLIDALDFILVSGLSRRLQTHQQRLESYYFDLSTDNTVSTYEKKKIIEEYSASLTELESRKKQIASYSRGLRTISKGHQELFENRNKLKTREIRILMVQFASDIEDIVAAFNKIKNED
jgi:hypothetical protein